MTHNFPMPMRFLPVSRLLVVCCGLLLLPLAGCDTLVTDEEIILPSPVEVRFEFGRDVDGLSAGSTLEFASQGTASVEGRLGGFSRDEIVRARLTGAQLRLDFPLGKNLSGLIQEAELQLNAPGLQEVVVATLGTPPSARTAQLQPTSQANNVGAYLAQPSFTATLVLTTQSLEADRYDFEVDLAFQVTVSGAAL